MASDDDDDLQVRPWLPPPHAPRGNPRTPAPDRAAEPGNWWDDLPDPWDRSFPDEPAAETSGGDGDHRPGPRPRRFGRDRSALGRSAVVVTVVGAVLVGIGVLVRVLTPEPIALTPPPTPPVGTVTSSPERSPEPEATPRPGDSPAGGASQGLPANPSPPAADPTPTRPTPTRPTPTRIAPPVTVTSEAEAADLDGEADAYPAEAASGGEAVQEIGSWEGGLFGMRDEEGDVRFSGVTVAEPGEYELTFHYLSETDRTGQFSVDDGERVTVDFPGLPDEDAVGAVGVPVELGAGDHTIWFGHTDARAPDLDRITLTG